MKKQKDTPNHVEILIVTGDGLYQLNMIDHEYNLEYRANFEMTRVGLLQLIEYLPKVIDGLDRATIQERIKRCKIRESIKKKA